MIIIRTDADVGSGHLRSADQGLRARYHGQGEARPWRRRPLAPAQLPLPILTNQLLSAQRRLYEYLT